MKLPRLNVQLSAPNPGKQVADAVRVATKVTQLAQKGVTDAFQGTVTVAKAVCDPCSANTQDDGKQYVVDGATGQPREYDPAIDGEALVYENGILNSKEDSLHAARALSAATGKPVVVTYNSSEGFVPDVMQSVLDKFDPFGVVHSNHATDTQAELMYQDAANDHPRTYVAHSQGAIVTRDAVVRTHARLYGEKFSDTLKRTHDPVRAHREAQRYADEKMQKNVRVITAGGAAQAWPPYANVTHITNTGDMVPNLFGQSVLFDPVETAHLLLPGWVPLPHGDRADVVVVDERTDPRQGFPGHSFEGVYLDDVAKVV
jgi:hypothetical protein